MDRNEWLQAIIEAPSTLEYAPPELQGDREIVLAAVSRDGATLRCAALELRGDPEIVETAVESDWEALRYISEPLRSSERLIRLGLAQHVGAVQCGNRDVRIGLMEEAVNLAATRGDRSEHRATTPGSEEEIYEGCFKKELSTVELLLTSIERVPCAGNQGLAPALCQLKRQVLVLVDCHACRRRDPVAA